VRTNRVEPILLERARELRKLRAPAETILWSVLRNRQLGNLKFRRQYAIESYIADFYCAEHKLIIEADGDSHSEQAVYDASRSKRLSALGFRVIRYTNTDVFENLEAVLLDILQVCEQ
jgi:very-short-patch-repair endonuclease